MAMAKAKKKSIGKIRLYVMITKTDKTLEFIPIEQWLRQSNRKTIYHFLYKLRLKALEIANIDIKTRKTP